MVTERVVGIGGGAAAAVSATSVARRTAACPEKKTRS
jgi:hypothetical protein